MSLHVDPTNYFPNIGSDVLLYYKFRIEDKTAVPGEWCCVKSDFSDANIDLRELKLANKDTLLFYNKDLIQFIFSSWE